MPSRLSGTVTLYMPRALEGLFPYVIFQERDRVGTFASRREALDFALTLSQSISRYHGLGVRLRVEDDDGDWADVELEHDENISRAVARS